MAKFYFAFLSICIVIIMTSAYNKQPVANEVQTDGPYVQYADGQVLVNYIVEKKGRRLVRSENIGAEMKESLRLKVMTDIPEKYFQIRLKRQLENEKSEYTGIKKLLALSDIEGNFGAFRKLLLANKVIDENFNWTFGEGHLVLIGDFFDRGQQVTEVLWLIYYLEEKAKAKGGYVHFILGNHEIMNLTGDLRYTPQKYLDNARLLSEDYMAMYDQNSELGRWLRTKNITEKIDNIIFVHGGISGSVNRLNISLDAINSTARAHFDKDFDANDDKAATIFGDLGPFWYRGYYDRTDRNIQSQIDSTLSQYKVEHIITGHTIVADSISRWYNGRLLDTDVHHAGGKSEALFIENGKYYRVNAEAIKIFLMEENAPGISN